MRRPLRGAYLIAAVALLGACGDTYIETSATTSPEPVVVTTLAPVDPATPLPDLLDRIGSLMLHLDEQIVAGEGHGATLEQIEALWDVAEPGVRAAQLDSIYSFEQALTYVRTGVTRRRPADASKGYKVWIDVVAAFDRAAST